MKKARKNKQRGLQHSSFTTCGFSSHPFWFYWQHSSLQASSMCRVGRLPISPWMQASESTLPVRDLAETRGKRRMLSLLNPRQVSKDTSKSHIIESKNGLDGKGPEKSPSSNPCHRLVAPINSGCPGPHTTQHWASPGMGHRSSLGSSVSSSLLSEGRISH